jgi:hypothetical protein
MTGFRRWLFAICLSAAPLACGGGDSDGQQGPATIEDLSLAKLSPKKLLPGSVLVVTGSFGDLKDPSIELDGRLDGQSTRITLAGRLIDSSRMEFDWPGGRYAGMPSDEGFFMGSARVLAIGGADLRLHGSAPKDVTLEIVRSLEPSLHGVEEGVIFVNHRIFVFGANFLLGGNEGSTVVLVEGCFTAQGSAACTPIADTAIAIEPEPNSDPERAKGHFPFAPRIAGIMPGTFKGSVRLRNDLGAGGGSSTETHQIAVTFELLPPQISEFSPARASLGQYVNINGGGFVGKDPADPTLALTTIELEGSFSAQGGPGPAPVSLSLVPEFVEGKLVRYVLNEEDALGTLTDLRKVTGDFSGTATPVAKYGAQTISGGKRSVSLGIDPIKQVVWVKFLPSYLESLQHFGLRAVDARIRERVLEVCRRDFQSINLDFRVTEPTDFALYSRVDVAGPDPNGMGLLGYDNTPGKDVGNKRLYDKIGGVNALTQEDGYPGYGGVFVESLFGFSQHPGTFASKLEVADPLFDQLFDPFRHDRKGQPVSAEDLAGANVPYLDDGSLCPAGKRSDQIACAVFALGSMIGTTTTHEVAHSLGLADPEGSDFHNPGDAPNRLMDGGAARSFRERAEIGDGPALFCQGDFEYLRAILPTNLPDFAAARPHCD